MWKSQRDSYFFWAYKQSRKHTMMIWLKQKIRASKKTIIGGAKKFLLWDLILGPMTQFGFIQTNKPSTPWRPDTICALCVIGTILVLR